MIAAARQVIAERPAPSPEAVAFLQAAMDRVDSNPLVVLWRTRALNAEAKLRAEQARYLAVLQGGQP